MSVTEPKSMVDQNENTTPVTKKLDGISEDTNDLPRVSTDNALPARVQNCSVRTQNRIIRKNNKI